MRLHDNSSWFASRRLLSVASLSLLLLVITVCSCSRGDNLKLPSNFKSLSTEDKMEYLMQQMPADSLARYLCNSAMGKVYNSRIELQPAMSYAYDHLSEEDQVKFAQAMEEYQANLPLHEKVRFAKLEAIQDPDVFSYELGLDYVGSIREEEKDIPRISKELEDLKKECKSDPEFYKRFMKGFKTALTYDRHHDLDENIYKKFISYPDSLK